jgi:signal transduction histidine kinase
VSTAIAPTAAATPSVQEAVLARRRVLVVVATLGLLTGVGGFILVATSDHLVRPLAYGLLVANVVVGTVGVALYWLVRRPGNRVGLLLLALGVAYAGISLQGAGNPFAHSIGVLFDAVVFALTYYVVFAFPEGKLTHRIERLLLAATVLVLLVSFIPWFFFSPVVSGGAPLATCTAACPENALMIADRPTLASGLGTLEQYLAVALAMAIGIALFYRLATATRPRRRALIPVYVPALVLTIVFGTFQAAGVGLIDLDSASVDVLGWFLTVARGTMSYGFLLALVQTALFAGVALKRMVIHLGDDPDAAHLRAMVGEALDDPSLELAFRVGGSGGFLDSSGHPIDPAHIAAGRSATAVERKGETVAFIIHDDGLDQDPELVRVAGLTMLLALENGRLGTDLASTIGELRASRARTVAAGDAERRKIERDLHDGAQQHLVALRVQLGLASELAETDPELAKARMNEFGDELEQILDELRRLAHGIYPSLLVDYGLVDALAAVARRASPPAKVEADGVGRYPQEIEAAVYFCCLEGLQNVGKHAGPDARAVTRVREDDGHLTFEISDDGDGYDVEQARSTGTGFTNMSDRIGALGGTLTVQSAPGVGTTVRGSVPLTRP